ncbi:MAG: hypothetical protein ACRD96_22475, partial [Bryobacteraceae bacterium]
MNARYRNCAVEASGLRLRAGFDVENASRETWRAAEGFAVGYHVFDPETDTLVVDGPRSAPAKEVAPGESAHWDVVAEIPPEPGLYRVFVSPMRENVAWYYERGWPFLLIDVAVRDGAARVKQTRLATLGSVRRRRLARSAGRALSLPLVSIWRNRSLIRTMVRRDVLGRYRGSLGGALWTLLTPLLLMLTYFFVFGVVLETRFGADTSRSGFALYFLAGMLPWLAFSEAAGRSP